MASTPVQQLADLFLGNIGNCVSAQARQILSVVARRPVGASSVFWRAGFACRALASGALAGARQLPGISGGGLGQTGPAHFGVHHVCHGLLQLNRVEG